MDGGDQLVEIGGGLLHRQGELRVRVVERELHDHQVGVVVEHALVEVGHAPVRVLSGTGSIEEGDLAGEMLIEPCLGRHRPLAPGGQAGAIDHHRLLLAGVQVGEDRGRQCFGRMRSRGQDELGHHHDGAKVVRGHVVIVLRTEVCMQMREESWWPPLRMWQDRLMA